MEINKIGSKDKRATVVGLGLIGGSIAKCLKRDGFHVSGRDVNNTTLNKALEEGIIDEIGSDRLSIVSFIATPLESVVNESNIELALLGENAVVSDVAGVKAAVVDRIEDARFIGGHPMAGSEQNGIEGATPLLFEGATWVLTPGENTNFNSYSFLQSLITTSFGATPLSLNPKDHDRFVAMVSHVPHLTAATLMKLASQASLENGNLLKLAAGGFRDMTRVAAGTPEIWPQVCIENKDAILEILSKLLEEINSLKESIELESSERILTLLINAQSARRELPGKISYPQDLGEIRVRVSDRPGELLNVLNVANELEINIFDIEIAHSLDGIQGVALLLVDLNLCEKFVYALKQNGYVATALNLSSNE